MADGRRLVSGSWDKTVRLWDVESGAELRCLEGHQGHVASVSFSADGRRLVSGSWDKTVRLWDVESGAELRCLVGHQDIVVSVSFSADGRRIVSGSADKKVRLWDVETGECIEVNEDTTDIRPFVEYRERVPFAKREGPGMALQSKEASPLAWWPELLEEFHCDASGELWAGYAGNYVAILRLEGNLAKS